MNPNIVKNYVNAQVGGIPRNRIVMFGASNTDMVLATSAGVPMMGVTQELATAQGERVDVTHMGIEFIEAGGAFTRGTILSSDSIGRVVGAGAGQWQIGRALESAAAAGDRVRVLVNPNYY